MQCCTQDLEVSTQHQEQTLAQEVNVVDGAVHFKDDQAFASTMKFLHEGGLQKLEDFEKSIGFENSLRSALIKSDDQDEEAEDELAKINIPDLYFASVVNQKGYYFIGNTIYKVEDEYEYALKNGNEELIEKTIQNQKRVNSNAIVQSIEGFTSHKITGLGISNNSSGRFSGETEYKTHWDAGEPKRVRMTAWSRNYVKYSSNGVNINTESYRRTCGICKKKWHDSAVGYLKIDGKTNCRVYANGTQDDWLEITEQEELYSGDEIQKVFQYVVAYVGPSNIDTEYIDCTFTYQRDDNNQIVSEFFRFTN